MRIRVFAEICRSPTICYRSRKSERGSGQPGGPNHDGRPRTLGKPTYTVVFTRARAARSASAQPKRAAASLR